MNDPLAHDPQLAHLLTQEAIRQANVIRLIPSENYVSAGVLAATGSVLTNKYSEGYPFKRYYQGQEFIDQVETLAIERAKKLFGVDHANVQPYSGSPTNLATYLALLEPGDTIMGLNLTHGGHLTHGWKVSVTSKIFRAVQYTVDPQTHLIDYNAALKLAKQEKPRLIICGATAYPRIFDFAKFATIAKEVGAYLVADIAHVAGLVAGGVHPTPVGHADVITTTTHKTLRGPRGGMIMCNAAHAQAIDRTIFPGLQGGPHNHTTAGIAVCLHEALQPEFKIYARQIVTNAQALAKALLGHGFKLITGGTDNHLILIDLTNKNIGGKDAAVALEKAGLETNANTIPYDPNPPMRPSGLRIGSPAVTSRGFKEKEMVRIADWINQVIEQPTNTAVLNKIKQEIEELCATFPAPGLETVSQHPLQSSLA